MELVRKRICRVLIIFIVLVSFTPVSLISKSAQSAVADSQMILPGGKASLREIDAEKVRTMLENKIVVERLKNYGLSTEEVTAKMPRMSDAQIHQLASLSDQIPAGGFYLSTTAIIIIIASVVVAGLIVAIVALSV